MSWSFLLRQPVASNLVTNSSLSNIMKSKTDFVCIEHNIVYVWNYFLLKNKQTEKWSLIFCYQLHRYNNVSGIEVSHHTMFLLHTLLIGAYGIMHLVLRLDLCLSFEIIEWSCLYSTVSSIIDWCVLSVLLKQIQTVVTVQSSASPMIPMVHDPVHRTPQHLTLGNSYLSINSTT